MNNSENESLNELADLLGTPTPPDIDMESQEQIRSVALAAFRESQSRRNLHKQRNLLLAAVLLLTGFVAGILFRPVNTGTQPAVQMLPLTDASELLANGKELFGNQIEAVVYQEGDLDWKISNQESYAKQTPFYLVHFADPESGKPISVIATSGSHFFIDQDREVEILEGINGRMIITLGDRLVEPETIEVKEITL